MKNRRVLNILSAALLALATSSVAQAQTWPSKPIRFVVPFGPGGGNDFLAREIATDLMKRLGQPVVVDNRPGAGGAIGTNLVAKAPADGYTILMAANSAVIGAAVTRSLPYDFLKDLTGVAVVSNIPIVLVVHPDVPAKNLAEFIAVLKGAPGKLNYASAGLGTVMHMATELFASATGTKMVHIPFKGAGQMVPEIVAGRVQVLFGAVNSIQAFMKTGQLRPLAVTSSTRSPGFPSLPTVAESGVPGYDVDLWYGVLAPSATPREVIAGLNREINAFVIEKQTRERFALQGMEVRTGTPEAFNTVMRSDFDRWARVSTEIGFKLD